MNIAIANITPADRLSLTVFVALVAHALVILGIGFTFDIGRSDTPPLIEITLAERPAAGAPKEYDFFAQANQDGGGEAERAKRPRQQSQTPMQGVPEGEGAVQAAPAPTPPPQPMQQPEVARTQKSQLQTDRPEQAAPDQQPVSATSEIINADRQVARESEFVEHRESGTPRFPSKLRVDARTKAHDAAAYMHEWVRQVERIGNLNYPDEARKRGLSGRVVLEVTLKPTGEVNAIKVLRRSGHRVLDESAMRIVRLAAPFPPVPPEVLKDNDLLVIVRAWEFIQDSEEVITR